ncbi:MAG: glycosyltransferase family 2 protein [Acidobacteria bacterium]|nr:glycosyltransferase family 2 protein [Acidobacteriota bacterium]
MHSNPEYTPLVSVIMPTYNTAHLITASLTSILAQTYSNVEIVVVNDGSPDTTELETALSPYADRIVYIRQENKRAAGARNTAIRRAQGEFVAFLDSDDLWFPHHLSSQIKLFAENPDWDLVYSDCFARADPNSQETFMEVCPSLGEAGFESLVEERCQIPISTVVARKQIIEKAGLFDESLVRCDDYSMWLKVAFWGGKIGYSRNIQARLSQGRPESLGLANSKMLEADWIILEKLLCDLPLSDEQQKCVSKRAATIHGQYLLEEAKLQLEAGNFDRAKELLGQANTHLQRFMLSLTQFGLGLAPQTTDKLITIVRQVRQRAHSRAPGSKGAPRKSKLAA